MAGVIFRKLALPLAACAAFIGAPAAATSEGYNFLKAVRERDGTKATQMLSEPGNTFVLSRDQGTGETALHIVVQRRDELWTRFLLERGADPNKPDNHGVTPFSLAASLGFIEGVQQMLKRGARIDPVNDAGETPLIEAVHRRDLPLIRLLLKNGANLDRTDNSGRSARDYAKLMGSAAGVSGEIERAEAERKAAPAQATYGPGL